MKLATLAIGLGLAIGATPLLTGCDREVAHEKQVEVKDNGTVKKQETTVKEKSDGTVVKEEKKSTDRP